MFTAFSVLVSCGGESTAPPQVSLKRGIVVVSGGTATDSVGTQLALPLIVEIHDSVGAVAPIATLVRFAAMYDRSSPDAYLTAIEGTDVRLSVSGKTDGSGRTGAYIHFGSVAGVARIVVDVPTLALRDTVRYTVLPGNAQRITFVPGDTGVLVGNPVAYQAKVLDAYGNARSDAVSWSVHGRGSSITPEGVLTMSEIGRATVLATANGHTDSSGIAAVPAATIAAIDAENDEIVSVNLDGTHRVVRARENSGGIGARPRWMPGSDNIIYSTLIGSTLSLRVVDSLRVETAFLRAPPPSVELSADAAPAMFGAWMYFTVWDSRCVPQDYCLARSRMDGTNVELLGDAYSLVTASIRPSPSPDGSDVAFVTTETGYSTFRLMHPATRTFSTWSIRGASPQWSPNGNTIAYIDQNGALSVVKTDGTGSRVLVPEAAGPWQGPFTWSPDSEWLLLRVDGGMGLVRASTGEKIVLPYLTRYYAPSWK